MNQLKQKNVWIKVHVINSHGLHSHLELVLERCDFNQDGNYYYNIDRWCKPENNWNNIPLPYYYTSGSDSIYTFDICADPNKLVQDWNDYYNEFSANILTENCADAVNKFLEPLIQFSDHRATELPHTWNHFFLGMMWPSTIPCPVTLPGQIMDKIKFHTKEKRYHFIPKITAIKALAVLMRITTMLDTYYQHDGQLFISPFF